MNAIELKAAYEQAAARFPLPSMRRPVSPPSPSSPCPTPAHWARFDDARNALAAALIVRRGLWAHLSQEEFARLDALVDEYEVARSAAMAIAAAAAAPSPRFVDTSCSQCGRGFGPGDHGYSACDEHEVASEIRRAA